MRYLGIYKNLKNYKGVFTNCNITITPLPNVNFNKPWLLFELVNWYTLPLILYHVTFVSTVTLSTLSITASKLKTVEALLDKQCIPIVPPDLIVPEEGLTCIFH